MKLSNNKEHDELDEKDEHEQGGLEQCTLAPEGCTRFDVEYFFSRTRTISTHPLDCSALQFRYLEQKFGPQLCQKLKKILKAVHSNVLSL